MYYRDSFVGSAAAISDTGTSGKAVSEWVGDQADGKQNLYRGNALHGADRKKEKAS